MTSRTARPDLWKTVRLELAAAEGFPHGSASRAFLLRLPLDATCRIDDATFAETPHIAAFRRFWPSEQDLRGAIVAQLGRYVLRADRAEPAELGSLDMAGHPLSVGRIVTFQPRGDAASLPFRVSSVTGRRRAATPDWAGPGYRARGTGPR